MKKRMGGLKRRAGWALAGVLGIAPPALAQFSPYTADGRSYQLVTAPANLSPPPKPEVLAGLSAAQARLEEMKVELAWLAHPSTFPYQLVARANGSLLEVHGYLPNEVVRGLAVQLARQHTNLAVADQVRIHASLATRATGVAVEDLQRDAADLVAKTVPGRAAAVTVKAAPNGKVTLTGSVLSWEEKLAISRQCRRLQGCSCVENLLAVSSTVREVVRPASASGDNRPMTAAPSMSVAPCPRPAGEMMTSAPKVCPPNGPSCAPTQPPVTASVPAVQHARAPERMPAPVVVPMPAAPQPVSSSNPVLPAPSDKKPASSSLVGRTATPLPAPAAPSKPVPLPADPVTWVASPGSSVKNGGGSTVAPGTMSPNTARQPVPAPGVPLPTIVSGSPYASKAQPGGASTTVVSGTPPAAPSAEKKDTPLPTIINKPGPAPKSASSPSPPASTVGASPAPKGPTVINIAEASKLANLPPSSAPAAPLVSPGSPSGPMLTAPPAVAAPGPVLPPPLVKKEQSLPPPTALRPVAPPVAAPQAIPPALAAGSSLEMPALAPEKKPGAPAASGPVALPPAPQSVSGSQPRPAAVASVSSRPAALDAASSPPRPALPAPEMKAAAAKPSHTRGVITFVDPEPEPASTASVSPELLTQRIAAVCEGLGRDVQVKVVSNTDLEVSVKARRADMVERLSMDILSMPELGPYKVDLKVELQP